MARRFTTQFKLEAVAMTRQPDATVASVARSLGPAVTRCSTGSTTRRSSGRPWPGQGR